MCATCESEAERHKQELGVARFLISGPPCATCEALKEKHANEGCGGLFIILTLTVGVLSGALRTVRRKP